MARVAAQEKVGLRLRAVRKARGMSQQELADAAGTTREHVVNIENGHVNLSISSTSRLSAALGVTLATFFSDAVFDQPDADAEIAMWAEPIGCDAAVMLPDEDAPGPMELVIAHLRANPAASQLSVAHATRLSRGQTERAFARLKSDGRIVRHGNNRSGHWEVIEPGDDAPYE